MNGIFGVGVAEVVVVGLALFIIGGPKNAAKWAHELGRMVRMAREAWSQVLTEVESELGPEGKELMDTARELGQGARDVTTLSPTKRLMSETVRAIESSTALDDATPDSSGSKPAAAETVASADASAQNALAPSEKYPAWVPPKTNKIDA